MRLFVALDLPEPILQNLETVTATLKAAARIQWSPVSKLHITTKFIGDWPDARLDELKSALAEMPRHGAIPIHVERFGWFLNPHSPRVFWAGVHATPKLVELVEHTERAMVRLGLPAETRDFHPHLTLARIKQPVDLAPLRQAVAKLDSVEFGKFEARSQFLYLSQSSLYTKLAEFPLS